MAGAPAPRRFAQALFLLAAERNSTEAWLDQLRDAATALGEPTVTAYLGFPQVRAEEKLGLVRQALGGLDDLVVTAVAVLVQRRGARLLPEVVAAYAALLDDHLGRTQANVTSAVPLSREQQRRLENQLASLVRKEVVLRAREDEDLMGGVVVRVGDQLIDGSVRSRLEQLRQRLARAPIG